MKKKRLLAIFLLLLLVIPTSIYAQVPDNNQINTIPIIPTLSFESNTAYCGLNIIGNSYNDSISAVLKLWRGSTLLAAWYASDVWILSMSESKTVSNGYLYKVTADVTINGVAKPTVSVSKYH